jgi:hypothetical protein
MGPTGTTGCTARARPAVLVERSFEQQLNQTHIRDERFLLRLALRSDEGG